MAQIEVIGIGLEGASGLSIVVKNIVEQATILIGSSRHLNYFPEHSATKILLNDFQKTIERIPHLLNTHDYIVILVSGDPLFFGLGRLLLEKLPAEQLRFHPHLSSIQLAFSRLKIPWQDAKLISLHGRQPDELLNLLQQGVEKIAILTDRNNNPSAIACLYLSLDLPIFYELYICENLGGETEKITFFSPEEIEKVANLPGDNFASLNVVVLVRQNLKDDWLDINSLPILGLPDRTFLSFPDRPGLMTKREIRLAILGELSLQPKQIIWDIGAGTGSVAIEIARLCPNSQVYAIEKTAIGITLIEQNCQRLQISNIIPIYGNAPEILSDLPSPNRVFIGGSGGNLLAILDICRQKINSNGLVVMALATLENLHQSLEWFKQSDWDYQIIQLQVSRSTPISNLTRFTPLNPVTIITGIPNLSRQKHPQNYLN
jgi:precorrin-6Y C5,15-methyltransferase (decarboxylating)